MPIPLLLVVLVVALGLGVLSLLLPSVVHSLVAIGLAAGFGLARPPALGWGLLIALLGYLAFRTGVISTQIPRDARVERQVLLHCGTRDLLVMAATAIAGGIAMLGQRLTGCDFTGASFAPMSDTNVVVQTCHPAGSALVVVAALAFLALFLGFAGVLKLKR